ncbi:MAG: hypothetical protein WCP35_19000 [Verrucomicrobiota bacterium]
MIEHPGWSTAGGWTPKGQGEELLLQDSHSANTTPSRPAHATLTLAGNASDAIVLARVGSARTLRLRSSPPLRWL